MKYRILIRAFTLRRDLAVSYLLAKLLEEKYGCEVVLACVRNYDFFLKHWKPHAVIINTIGKTEDAKKYSTNLKLIHWPAEGGQIKNSDITLLIENQNQGPVDLYLFWGEITKKLFTENFREDSGKARVCGSPRLDLLLYGPEAEKQESIGIIGRFNSLNHYDKRPAIFSLANYHNLSFIQAMCAQFVAVYRAIEQLVEKTDCKISIRPHPLEAPEGYYFIKKRFGDRVEIDDSLSFANWLRHQKMLISPASTTFVEAYLLGIPVINIDGLTETATDVVKKRNEVTALAYDLAFNPETYEELVEMVKSPPSPKRQVPSLDKYLKEYSDFPYEGSAVVAGAKEIFECLSSSKFKKEIFIPKKILFMKDWYLFKRLKYFGGTNHENFNYNKIYHKIPEHLDETLKNINTNKRTFNRNVTEDRI